MPKKQRDSSSCRLPSSTLYQPTSQETKTTSPEYDETLELNFLHIWELFTLFKIVIWKILLALANLNLTLLALCHALGTWSAMNPSLCISSLCQTAWKATYWSSLIVSLFSLMINSVESHLSASWSLLAVCKAMWKATSSCFPSSSSSLSTKQTKARNTEHGRSRLQKQVRLHPFLSSSLS